MAGVLVQTFQNTLALFTPSFLHVACASCVADLNDPISWVKSKSPYSTLALAKGPGMVTVGSIKW
jgi:hypothetical protein